VFRRLDARKEGRKGARRHRYANSTHRGRILGGGDGRTGVTAAAVPATAGAPGPAVRPRALLLVLLLIIALPPRLYDLGGNPPALNADEIGNLTPFLSIIRTGRDSDGRLLPFTYHRLTRRPPLYGLLALPGVMVFGRSALVLRLPAVLLGVGGLVLLWVLGDRLLRAPAAGAVAAFVMAAAPWHIHYSRIGWEPATVVPLLLAALLLWTRALDRARTGGRDPNLAPAAAVLAATIYGYKAFDVLAPVWLAALLWLARGRISWPAAARAVGAFGLVYLPLLYTSLVDPSMHRWAAGIFTFAGGINAGTLGAFARNYLAHFSPSFLFIAGDPNGRHHAPGTGMLFWWMLPLLAAGLAVLARRRDLAHRGVLVAWLLLYPLGGSLTNDQPVHASRTLPGLPALCLLAALGLGAIVAWIGRRRARPPLVMALAAVLAGAIAVEGARFAAGEYVRYPLESWRWWDYGQAEVFQTVRARGPAYDRACLGTMDWFHQPVFIEYYLPASPIPIMSDPRDVECTRPGTLLALRAGAAPPHGAVLERVIHSPLGERIFLVFGLPR
jgi:4-amino-4-deoxy-L-arabinose transferase-like glycosyltransferase